MARKGEFKKGAKRDSVRQRKYNSLPLQKKRRAMRNAARKKAVKKGRARKGDGKDVDHLDRKSLSPNKTRVIPKSKNRAKNSPLGLKRDR